VQLTAFTIPVRVRCRCGPAEAEAHGWLQIAPHLNAMHVMSHARPSPIMTWKCESQQFLQNVWPHDMVMLCSGDVRSSMQTMHMVSDVCAASSALPLVMAPAAEKTLSRSCSTMASARRAALVRRTLGVAWRLRTYCTWLRRRHDITRGEQQPMV
jgi:hypothetical protein